MEKYLFPVSSTEVLRTKFFFSSYRHSNRTGQIAEASFSFECKSRIPPRVAEVSSLPVGFSFHFFPPKKITANEKSNLCSVNSIFWVSGMQFKRHLIWRNALNAIFFHLLNSNGKLNFRARLYFARFLLRLAAKLKARPTSCTPFYRDFQCFKCLLPTGKELQGKCPSHSKKNT